MWYDYILLLIMKCHILNLANISNSRNPNIKLYKQNFSNVLSLHDIQILSDTSNLSNISYRILNGSQVTLMAELNMCFFMEINRLFSK